MIKPNQRPAIVAVFGPSRKVPKPVLDLARCVGSKIAAQGFVVLTGGTMKEQEHPRAVKNAALKGAEPDGDWIGVLQDGNCPDSRHDGSCADLKPDGKGRIIYSDMGHQRNILEALLCDAGVVLAGAEGTISEAVSTLCLGKPVLFCGSTHTEDRPAANPLFNIQKALYQLFETQDLTERQKSDLVKVTVHRLRRGNENGVMKDRIAQTVKAEKIQLPERSCLVPATDPEPCQAIAGWLTELETLPLTGEFPDLGGKYSQMKVNYDEWLNGLSRPAQ
jgi:predicted Rossmann-fold nucleotide-binding protein